MESANLGGGGGFKNRPKALMCYICGREYGTKSLSIHIKACIQKWEIEENKKPKKERRPLPQPPKQLMDLLDKSAKGETINWNDLENYNEKANDKWNDEALINCEFCNRTFLPDRLPIHRKICTAEKPFKPLPKKERNTTSYSGNEPMTKSAMDKTSMSNQKPIGKQQQQVSQGYDEAEDFGYSTKDSNIRGGSALKNSTFAKKETGYIPSTKNKNSYNFSGNDQYQELDLVPCSLCGRNFAQDRIAKHQSACQKLAKAEAKHAKRVQKAQKKLEERDAFVEKANQYKKSNWRAAHEDFVNNLKYMRKFKKIQQNGGDVRTLGPPPKQQQEDNLVPCPYCGRKFNPVTAERHIPKCKDIINKPKPPPNAAYKSPMSIPSGGFNGNTGGISKPTQGVTSTLGKSFEANTRSASSKPVSKAVNKNNFGNEYDNDYDLAKPNSTNKFGKQGGPSPFGSNSKGDPFAKMGNDFGKQNPFGSPGYGAGGGITGMGYGKQSTGNNIFGSEYSNRNTGQLSSINSQYGTTNSPFGGGQRGGFTSQQGPIKASNDLSSKFGSKNANSSTNLQGSSYNPSSTYTTNNNPISRGQEGYNAKATSTLKPSK